MSKNVHAEAIAQYAVDWTETSEPWKRWEACGSDGRWTPVHTHPTWNPSRAYRRKRETININGHEVPKPLTEVPDGAVYVPHLEYIDMYAAYISRRWIKEAVRRGIAHATPADAALHAKALLSFTEASSDE